MVHVDIERRDVVAADFDQAFVHCAASVTGAAMWSSSARSTPGGGRDDPQGPHGGITRGTRVSFWPLEVSP